MARRHIDVPVPALALRRSDAAAALGVSTEVFDLHIRPHVPAVRAGSVTTYPVAGLQAWLAENAHTITEDISRRTAA